MTLKIVPWDVDESGLGCADLPRYKVTVYLDASHLAHAGLYGALYSLAAGDKIEVEMRTSLWSRKNRKSTPLVLVFQVAANGREKHICFEFFDRSDAVELPLLRDCDVYFKRCLYRPHLAELPPELQRKILPLGAYLAGRAPYGAARAAWTLATQSVAKALTSPRQCREMFRSHVRAGKKYFRSPLTESCEQSPEEILEPIVNFQTRVWEQDDTSDNASDVNEQRAGLVRALREAFGPRFWGGLAPTPLALQRYPDAVSPHQTGRGAYIGQSKRHLIGIYTRGLHHSLAFKLAEYMAASKCIVSDPIRNELSPPFVDGSNYLCFQTFDECVRHCSSLLDNPEQALAMRKANWSHYQRYIRPDAQLMWCLNRAFAN